jgi:hypothetical protein
LRFPVLARQIFDLGKTQIPALVQFGVLRLLPELVHLAPDETLDINAGAHLFHSSIA